MDKIISKKKEVKGASYGQDHWGKRSQGKPLWVANRVLPVLVVFGFLVYLQSRAQAHVLSSASLSCIELLMACATAIHMSISWKVQNLRHDMTLTWRSLL